ncbi:MAG: hypothetical protein LRY54_04555 [Alphaproteobacteria bacterium]|nr:hypothetical protein [Alphaproteobacteria bacterium]
MKRALVLSGLSILSLTLVACGFDRDAQDKKLVKACQAAVEYILPEKASIDSVNNTVFGFSETLGNGKNYRTVTLSVSQKNDEWYKTDKDYECVFIESLNIGGFSMKSDLYQVKDGETVYGRDDKGNVIGDLNHWLGLNDKAKDAMGR